MRLTRLQFKGLTRFSNPVDIDLAEATGLVALVGDNGSGKTTTMESVPAALFKSFPTRPGSLYDYCHGRDAYVAATFAADDGSIIESKVLIDAEKRTSEGYITVDGQPVTDGKARQFSEWITGRFGPQSLFFASVFAPQDKRGSLLDMTKGERKEVFAALLGLQRMQALSVDARERTSVLAGQLDRHRTTLLALGADREALANKLTNIANIESEMHDVTEASQSLDAKVLELEGQLAKCNVDRLKIADAKANLLAMSTALEQSRKDRALLSNEMSSLKLRHERMIATFTAFPYDAKVADAKRRHTLAVEFLDRKITELAAAIAQAEPSVDESIDDKIGELGAAMTALEDELASYDMLRGSRFAAESAVRVAKQQYQVACDQRKRDADAVAKRTVLLGVVPCARAPQWEGIRPDEVDPPFFNESVDLAGTCPLLKDAQDAAKVVIPEITPAMESAAEAHDDAQVKLDQILTKLADTDRAAIEQEIRDCDIKLKACGSAKDLVMRLTEWHRELGHCKEHRDAANKRLEEELAQIQSELAENTSRADELTKEYEGDSSELKGRLASAMVAMERAEEAATDASLRLTKIQNEASTDPTRDLQAAKQESKVAAEELAGWKAELSKENALIGEARERVRIAEGLEAKVASIEGEIANWRLLADGLGPNGVQAYEIDCAGPEVTSILNALLLACYGPRFSVVIETQRDKVGGGTKEVFDIVVFDGGAERTVEALSGGEKVVVGEALGLAVAIYNARKSGIHWKTIWRDESAGALDPGNAAAYVRMLRRAQEIGGFDSVIFICHSPEVWEAADARFIVADGKVAREAA